jgi:hypothetical protein
VEVRLEPSEYNEVLLKRAAKRLSGWLHGDEGFYSSLFALLTRADPENSEKLKLAFPYEGMMWNAWFHRKDDGSFEEIMKGLIGE